MEAKISKHEAFLRREPAERPLLGFWRGGYYPAEQFPSGTAAWPEGQILQPDDVRFAHFAADYEALYRLHGEAEDDYFFFASAYWGIPWMEAILGCTVVASRTHCRAENPDVPWGDFPPAPVEDNPWFPALLRFTVDLLRFADGRFPVCPPLLRGPGDCAAALLGGMRFVLGCLDEPERMSLLLGRCADARSHVVRGLQSVLADWHGTYIAGGYPSRVWSRIPIAYHQEDSASLLNPELFRRLLLPLHRRQCLDLPRNFFHLHSSCLYPAEIFLEHRCFDALQINVDHPGSRTPSLPELIPALKNIQEAGMPLLLWGELTAEHCRLLRQELSPVGLSLQPIATAPRQMAEIRQALYGSPDPD